MINRGHVKLSSMPNVNSVSVNIAGVNSLLLAQFNLLPVDDSNISIYSDSVSGDYVLSWIGLSDTETLLRNNDGQKLEVQYVTDNTDSQTINQVDYTNWDNSVKYYHEYFTNEDPVDSIELTYLPIDSSLMIFINGIFQTKGKDYTVNGKTIDFVTSISSGFYISVVYMY